MSSVAALRASIHLMQVPSSVRAVRQAPLPDGMEFLLLVAARDAAAIAEAVHVTGRTPDFIANAAAFFVEQILFAPGADCYRVLGAMPGIPTAALRRHMALLMRWAHPDVTVVSAQSLFVNRVTSAWEELKAPERRAVYDQKFAPKQTAVVSGTSSQTASARHTMNPIKKARQAFKRARADDQSPRDPVKARDLSAGRSQTFWRTMRHLIARVRP
jgi:hypothetical protein